MLRLYGMADSKLIYERWLQTVNSTWNLYLYTFNILFFCRIAKIQGQLLVFNLVPCVSRAWCAVAAAVCRIEKMQMIRFIDLGDSEFLLFFYLWRNTSDGPLSVIALYWPDVGYRFPLGFAARREYVLWDILKITEMNTAATGAYMRKKVLFRIMYVHGWMWFYRVVSCQGHDDILQLCSHYRCV